MLNDYHFHTHMFLLDDSAEARHVKVNLCSASLKINVQPALETEYVLLPHLPIKASSALT